MIFPIEPTGGHRIKSAVYFDLRFILTAGGAATYAMLIAYNINK